jgi:hypothetical protein
VQKITTLLVDDLDPKMPAVETIKFGVDGAVYKIDLAAPNAQKLREELRPYVENARKTGRLKSGTTGLASGLSRAERDDARAWGRNNGFPVGDKGRLSAELLKAWRARNRKSVAAG